MGYNSVLDCAISQIGQGNDADGSNKYNLWYWGYRSKAPWCAVFIAWCFKQTGIFARLSGLDNKAGCEPWRRWAVANGIFFKTPKVGSIVLFDWNPKTGDGADHIGIVEKINKNSDGSVASVGTIEGNTSWSGSQDNGGKVLRKTRYPWQIMGYVYVDTKKVTPVSAVTVYGEGKAASNQAVYSLPYPDKKTKVTLRENQQVLCYSTHDTDGVRYWHADNARNEWVIESSLHDRVMKTRRGFITYGYGKAELPKGVRVYSCPGSGNGTTEMIGQGTTVYCYSTNKTENIEWWSINSDRTKWVKRDQLADVKMVKKWNEIK